MGNILKIIKYKWLEWQWDRVLKRSGCRDWYAYMLRNDPDFDINGYSIAKQLIGYPYIANPTDWDYVDGGLHGLQPQVSHIFEWCAKNCKGKYYGAYNRVVKDHAGQYVADYYGDELLFIGFKNERDYIMFTLRWT